MLRLRVRDGATRWLTEIPRSPTAAFHEAHALAIAPSGLVVVGGTTATNGGPLYDETFTVVAFDQNDGAERWRYDLQSAPPPTSNGVRSLAIDGAGGVVAGGNVTLAGGGVSYAVVALDGATGSERWRSLLPIDAFLAKLVLTAAGDVAVGPAAAIVDRGHGHPAPRWRRRHGSMVAPAGRSADRPVADLLGELQRRRGLPNGDVAAAGRFTDADGAGSFVAAVLAGADGAGRWRRHLINGGAGSLAVAPDGRLALTGTALRPKTCSDGALVELDAASGAVGRIRLIDGTTRARSCERPICDTPRCGGRDGIDNDFLNGAVVLPSGRVVFAGGVSDGRRGRSRGLIGSLRLD